MKTLPLLSAVALLLLGASPFLSPPARATTYNIYITSDGFDPSYLEVTAGDRVNFWNLDYDYYELHSTRCDAYPWNSGPISVGYGVYFSPTKVGRYDYLDDWGYSGFGTLVVKSAGPPPPPSASFIAAPGAVDSVYDPARDLLYITSGSSVLCYQLAAC